VDLSSFKKFVDANITELASEVSKYTEALLGQIRACFTPKESNIARADIKNILDDLGLRYLCELTPYDPYFGVAEVLHQTLREQGTSDGETSNWERAIELAVMYSSGVACMPPEQVWRSNVRVSSLSVAINGLRGLRYNIGLPDVGGVDVPESETKRLAADIERQAASLGHTLAQSAAECIKNEYSAFSGRFKVGRQGQTVRLDAKPDRPFSYLYQLGLRYFELPPSAPFPAATFAQLVDLVTWATALLDLSVGTFELMFTRNEGVLRVMQKLLIYDSVFLLTQAKPAHACEYLEWMMSRYQLANLKDKQGRTSSHILAVAKRLLWVGQQAGVPTYVPPYPQDFIQIPVIDAAYVANLDPNPAQALLREVFAHQQGANQALTFPPDDKAVDAAFRPLLMHNGMFFMQPAPMAARATVNAALQWCRENSPMKGNFDDKVLGSLFEIFVRDKLAQHGVNVLHGDYKEGQSKGECDAVVEAKNAVIFFELKSKMLRRQSRAGDDVSALADLAQAVVRPQAQALERHAFLRKHGAMTLVLEDASKNTITLGQREVLKLSITRGDLGSLHDRAFLPRFLQTGCVSEFATVDPMRQDELKSLHEWFRKLKAAAALAGESIFDAHAFSTSWSLSVFHLLLLLEHTYDNESFSQELQRTRRVMTPLMDFYAEYEYMLLVLDKHRKLQEQQTA
jgi:Holliday junction resolvase-like predicted endonuclease